MLDGGTNRIIDTVSDDEDFDVIDALRLHTRHCERQRCRTVTMGRNENANSGHRVQQIVLRASAAPAVSATRGYASWAQSDGLEQPDAPSPPVLSRGGLNRGL